MDIKKKLQQTKKAISTTATKTKVAVKNANMKEKTKLALVNIKEKTKDVTNVVVETTKQVATNISSEVKTISSEVKTKYHTITDQDKDKEVNGASGTIEYVDAKNDLVITEETRVFAVPLEVACNHSKVHYNALIPDVVYKCIVYLHAQGIQEEGIFRMSGSITLIKRYRDQFDAGIDVDISDCNDPHAISGLLKMFLRDLPDPIITEPLYLIPEVDQIESIKEQAENLPPINRCLLGELMKVLHQVYKNKATTKMTINNLSIIFCPTLQCASDLMGFLIENAYEIFGDEDHVDYGKNITPDVVVADDLIQFGDDFVQPENPTPYDDEPSDTDEQEKEVTNGEEKILEIDLSGADPPIDNWVEMED